jgi:hypothetical protein
VAQAPEGLVLERHRDLEGRRHEQWFRRALIALVAAFVVAGLVNVFGQRPATATVRSSAADLEVYAPKRLRSGLYYETRSASRSGRTRS